MSVIFRPRIYFSEFLVLKIKKTKIHSSNFCFVVLWCETLVSHIIGISRSLLEQGAEEEIWV